MDKYSLRFATANNAGETTVSFYAHSTSSALDLARESASGDWAELYLNGASVCTMQMVADTGVWRVNRSSAQTGTSDRASAS